MLIYYLFRILTKVWISYHLEEHQKYFPGVLPLYFIIFDYEITDNRISYRIERRSHFSKSKEIHKNESSLNSEEMLLFKQGLKLCRDNYYFAKWTVIPVFLRNDGVFSTRFFFMEPMVNARGMYIQYDFSLLTHQVIGYNRRSGRIQS
jgi:hypothetical protein